MLWVKGSGTDLATITTAGFPGLRLDDVLTLRARDAMDDAAMVDYLLRSALRPDQPRPSIETLLHAFVAADHVDHTHPDAVIALTSTPDGRRLAEEAFGDEAVWLDYQRPGFDMSTADRRAARRAPQAPAPCCSSGTGSSPGATPVRRATARTLEFVTRAAQAIDRRRRGSLRAGRQKGRGAAGRRLRAPSSEEALPALRGALLADADGVVLEVDRSPEAVAFASAARAAEVSQIGAPCPDHLINTKHKPARRRVRSRDARARRSCATRSAAASRSTPHWYRALLRAKSRRRDAAVPDRSRRPARRARARASASSRAGGDAGRARFARDLYHRAIAVEDAADALGGFHSLSESEAFAIEYWPLERYKLAQAPPPRRARRPRRARSRAVRAGSVARRRGARRARRPRRRRRPEPRRRSGGCRRARQRVRRSAGRLAVAVDVTDESAVQEMIAARGARVRRYRHPRRVGRPRDERTDHRDDARGVGAELRRARPRLFPRRARGVPRLARAGARRVGRLRRLEERSRRRRERGRVLVGEGGVAASRALPGRGGRPARHPRQHGQPGRRHPGLRDLVVRLEGGARKHLRRHRGRPATASIAGARSSASNVYPEDVAEAISFLAGPRAAKSTGNVINVDGGVTAAYPTMSDGPEATASSSSAAISKSYGGVQALTDVSFSIERGTVHALVGENGAGKSTLVKILTGVVAPRQRRASVRRAAVRIGDRADGAQARHRRHVPGADGVPRSERRRERVRGPASPRARSGRWTGGRCEADAMRILDELGVDFGPDTPVRGLGVADRQLLEIAKALSTDARLLIMDEPTAALSPNEVENLFATVRQLRDRGVAVIFISHRLEEIGTLADTVTVLRDGRHIETRPAAELHARRDHPADGRALARRTLPEGRGADRRRRVARRRASAGAESSANVSFELRRGEIVGLAGFVGAGRTEVARSIFGVDPPRQRANRDRRAAVPRRARLAPRFGAAWPISPRTACTQGLVQPMSIGDNVSMAVLLDSSRRAGFSGRDASVRWRERFMAAAADQGDVARAGRPQPLGRQPAEGRARRSGSPPSRGS